MGKEEIHIEPEYLPLLKSLEGGKKYLHMGRSPVKAIELAFKWEDLGLISIDNESCLNLTSKEKELLK